MVAENHKADPPPCGQHPAEVDGRTLRRSGRGLKTPFEVRVRTFQGEQRVACGEILRVLPGKRLVCFGRWRRHAVVVKFFLHPKGAARHFGREANGLRAFHAGGVRAPQILFTGTLRPESTPVLCLERLRPARDLESAWREAADDRRRSRLLELAAEALADQHSCGLRQEDPYRRNFLLCEDRVYSIDGDAVDTRRAGRSLGRRASLRNLALFLTQFYPRYRSLFAATLDAYARRRRWRNGPGFLDQMMGAVHQQMGRRQRIMLGKLYRETTAHVRRRSWRTFMVCRREWFSPAMRALLADPDAAMERNPLLKAGNTATVARLAVDGRPVVVKRYNIKNWRHFMRRCARPSRAWISWRNAHLLSLWSIPTAPPVALVEKRWGPFRRQAYYISEYLCGTDMQRWRNGAERDAAERAELLRGLQRLLRRLNLAEISHGDFKATNFLVAGKDLCLLDLDVLRRHRWRRSFESAFARDCRRLLRNWQGFPEMEQALRKIIEGLGVDSARRRP